MAASAAALTKNGLVKALRRRHSLHCSFETTCSKHSIPKPPSAVPKNIGDRLGHHQLQQSRWCSRKTKELEFSTRSIISSMVSSVRMRSSSSPISGLVGWYLGMIKTRPVATKSITSAFIYTAADLSSQTIAGEASEGYDLVRTVRMAGYGMLIIGPSLHYWFNFVSRVFPNRDLLSTFTKMGLGQMVYGPIVTTVFFSLNAALQAVGEQLIFIPMDGLPNLHGKLIKSWFELRGSTNHQFPATCIIGNNSLAAWFKVGSRNLVHVAKAEARRLILRSRFKAEVYTFLLLKFLRQKLVVERL